MAVKRCADIAVSARPRKVMRVVINSWSRFLPPYIPDDVMFSILSWLPSKSLIRFKSVCKAWHATISSSRFINAHLKCSKQRPSILMVPGAFEKQKNGNNIAFLMSLYKYQDTNIMHLQDFPQGICKWIRPVHCNGLVLISTRKHEMMICNPSTREIVSLPKGSRSLCDGMGIGFGFDPHSNKYKVARAFYQRDDDTSRHACKFEVLTLGSTAWRQTEDPPYPIDSRTLALEIWTCSVGQNPEWTRCCTVQIPPDLVIKHSIERHPLVVFHERRLLLASYKVYRYDTRTCKMEKIASTFQDFTCYDSRNSQYRTFLKKEVMDFHLFNYAESLVPIREF
ncbi:hypothetical protein E2562_003086 [Oryza meyeriana var. granulata]|uniref:F-box domain-containing protein n=1 Tax=Oryza meyeriana var. granulata TaxID=110450 RepID=A0A6G1E913_9ORYZ|nr:hypothetical protein E2562_003086 [Oryza meyeriana var. granulata]